MGEREPPLTAGQIGLPAASIDADREMATQFDGYMRGWQLSEVSRGFGPDATRQAAGPAACTPAWFR
jgi:hypothetical protein